MSKKKPEPASSAVEEMRATVEEMRAWWEENVGPFDPEPDGRDWPRWKFEVWMILHRHWEQERVAAAEGSRGGASTGGSKSSRTVPSLVRYVKALVRSCKGATNDELWYGIPETGDPDADVCRDGNKLFDHTTEGGGRSITRNTFDKYVAKAREKRDKLRK